MVRDTGKLLLASVSVNNFSNTNSEDDDEQFCCMNNKCVSQCLPCQSDLCCQMQQIESKWRCLALKMCKRLLLRVHLEDGHNRHTAAPILYSLKSHFWHLPLQIPWGSCLCVPTTLLPGLKVMPTVAYTNTASGEQCT